jgi:hypothetical protein
MMSASEKYQAQKRSGRNDKYDFDDKEWLKDTQRL